MSELQRLKMKILNDLEGLCAHCSTRNGRPHRCPVREISQRVVALRGVPLMVNDEFRGVLWQA